MAAKYLQIFQLMLKENEKALSDFKLLHDKYEADPKAFQEEYNREGEEFLQIIQKYENMLTSHSENAGFSKFSTSLSDRFRAAVKQLYPKLDFIGVQIR
jgi:hypothetical protein